MVDDNNKNVYSDEASAVGKNGHNSDSYIHLSPLEHRNCVDVNLCFMYVMGIVKSLMASSKGHIWKKKYGYCWDKAEVIWCNLAIVGGLSY